MQTTKKFSLLQLLAVIDGRISTNDEDIMHILNHVFNTSILVHEIPHYLKELKLIAPAWFVALESEIDTIKLIHGANFYKVIEAIKKDYNFSFDIPQLK